MKKRILIASLFILGSAVLAGSHSTAEAGVSATVTSGHTSIHFDTQPEVVVVPGSRVYYCEAPSYDVYRYGNTWWVDRGGVWYRATSYRGPFIRASFEVVPRQIIIIPAEYHRHDNGLHKGWAKQYADNGHGNGHGNGSAHGHGKGHHND